MAHRPDVNSPEFWEEIYQQGRAGWDLGGPTPVFLRLLQVGEFAPGRMLVPCAGRGHDAREFARYGFTVDAVEFAQDAAEAILARQDAQAPVALFQRDLFELPTEWRGRYDYVLEYTCFCAIDPVRRAEYADLVTRLLKPGGHLIHLAFPLDEHGGGPPFSVSAAEIVHLYETRGVKLLRRETPADSVPQRRGSEELLIFQRSP
ncbi:MAG: TPMT family class I SAM-dependent methyltransferase [Chloroflexi bacterium]|nr:TPMT family class I SAM-dependent methyltransferase [Chloroflexota bacterium]